MSEVYALVYVPQPDLRGHLLVYRLDKELEPGVYFERVRIPGEQVFSTRGSLVELFLDTVPGSWGEQLRRELEPFMDKIKYVIVQFIRPYFTDEATIIAKKDKVTVAGDILEYEKLEVDLDDKRVTAWYRRTTESTKPRLKIEDKFEHLKHVLNVSSVAEVNLPEDAKRLLEEISATVNEKLTKIDKSLLSHIDQDRLKRLLLLRELLSRVASLDSLLFEVVNYHSKVKKIIRSGKAKEELDKLEALIEEKITSVTSVAAFMIHVLDREIDSLIEEARRKASQKRK